MVCCTFCCLWAWSRRHLLIERKKQPRHDPRDPRLSLSTSSGCCSFGFPRLCCRESTGHNHLAALAGCSSGHPPALPCLPPAPPSPKQPCCSERCKITLQVSPCHRTRHSTRADPVNGKGGCTLSEGEGSSLPLCCTGT